MRADAMQGPRGTEAAQATQAPAASVERAIAREAAFRPGTYGEQRALVHQLAQARGARLAVTEQYFHEEIVRKALRDARESGYVPRPVVDMLSTTNWSGGGWSMSWQGGDRSVLRAPSGEAALVDTRTGQAFFLESRGATPVAARDGEGEAVALVPDAPPRFEGPEVMERLFPIVAVVFVCLTLMTLGLPIVKAWVRRFERRGTATRTAPDDAHRFDRLEQAMEAVAIEVERIGEAQRYQTKLFAERAPAFAPLVERTTVDAPPRPNRTPPEGVAH